MAQQPVNDQINITDSSGLQTSIQFKNIVEWINEGLFCVNSEGVLLYANTQFCRNLGYQLNEVIGSSLFRYFPDEEQAKLYRQKLELRKKGLSDSFEIKMRKKNGDQVWVRLNGRPVFDTNGKFVASIAIHTDITKQKLLEEELILAKEDLESKVITRTRQISEANQKLSEQIKQKRLAEISLKHTEQRFHDIYLNSPDAIYIESYEGIVIDVNDATCKLHHLTREELIGKNIYEISPERDHADIRKRQPKLISGEVTKFESECITKEGDIIPIEISAAHTEFNNKKALLMHVRDISDRKKSQELLQNLNAELEEKVKQRTAELESINELLQTQKNFFRQILDSTPSLIFVKDQEGKFLLANESVAQFYNKTTEEMEGHYDDAGKIFSENDIENFKYQDEEALRSGKEVLFPEQSYNHGKTGKLTWLQAVKKPIPSLSDKSMNILGVATDVTAIKEAKEELRKSEQLYREIAGNLPKAALFIFDRDFRYRIAEGPLVGIISKPKNEIEGTTIFETVKEEERERVRAIYQKILDGESSESDEIFFGRYMKIYHIPIRDEDGKVMYGMVMAFDVSDLKNIQKELEKRATELQRSNEELERFAYVASHDLQGPLRTIASYLQLLEMRYAGKLDAEATEFIHFSVNGAKRMQTLIQDLLSFSKLSSAPKPFSQVDVGEVVNAVLMSLDSSVKLLNAKMNVSQFPLITADPNQIYQLFQNLIDNALKFSAKGKPEVKITWEETPDFWKFAVKDNGIGIRPEFKEKIFQIFQRLHTDSEYTGTGVGLAICKKIAQLHGGDIWFDSEPGKGTTFYFTIRKHKLTE